MPILTEADPPRKRRAPVWALIPVVVFVLLVGVLGWSWYRPVSIHLPDRGIGFGYGPLAEKQALQDLNANAQRRMLAAQERIRVAQL